MIDYDPEVWGVAFIFRISGSVFPKGLMWAIPSAALSVLLHMYFREEGHEFEDVDEGIRLGISSYSVALSFLVIFRTQQAYSRWWEGGSLLQTMRGEWYNAFSNLLSFTTRNPERRSDVDAFQHLLVRFMSLLHGTALQQVSTTSNLFFELVDLRGVDTKHLEFLKDCEDRCEVVMQWVQRITVEAFEGGILPIPAPILSRVFQELSRGIVNLANARKISELPFPFPYAQMITCTLIIHWMMMPVLMAHLCRDAWWAGILTFVTVFWNWSLNYVAQEIESPFGDDANDLPLVEMQMNFNRMLTALIMQEAQEAPRFIFKKEYRKMRTTCMRSGNLLGEDLGFAEAGPIQTPVLRTQATFDHSAEEAEPELRLSERSESSTATLKWELGRSRKKRPSRFAGAHSKPDVNRKVRSPRVSLEGVPDDDEEAAADEVGSTRSSKSTVMMSEMGFYSGADLPPGPRGPLRSSRRGSGSSTPDSLPESQAI